jgi:hypothetical protein
MNCSRNIVDNVEDGVRKTRLTSHAIDETVDKDPLTPVTIILIVPVANDPIPGK